MAPSSSAVPSSAPPAASCSSVLPPSPIAGSFALYPPLLLPPAPLFPVSDATSDSSDGGTSTASITCTTPLLASTSAPTTAAPSTVTVFAAPSSFTPTVSSPPSSVLIFWPSVRLPDATAAPAATWYLSSVCSDALFAGSSSASSTAFGTAANAALVGANTVSGPAPDNAPARSPAVTAVTRVERSGVAAASSTMFFRAGFGRSGFLFLLHGFFWCFL